MDKPGKDVSVLRRLAAEVAEIAALPVQEEKRALWRALNARKPARPMVLIDQVCWNEMNPDGALTLQCTDPECRAYEERLRRTLYKWRHFPVDMVVDPFIRIYKAVRNTGYGVQIREETAVTDPQNAVVGHKYENQFQTEADLDKIRTPQISHDLGETQRRLAVAHELFDGLLEIRPVGMEMGMALWDAISMWMGVENALYTIVDNPDYMHRLMGRLTDACLGMIDQLEAQGLMCDPQSLIHCTGAYTDELPAPGYNPQAPRAKDVWICGMAQMFSTVSPAMHREYEMDYISRIAARYGLVYYGCCEPLDGKMAEVRRIPNVRKVSMSPWVSVERGAAAIHGDYVFSRKPSPALLATDPFRPEDVRADLTATRDACEKHGCPLEFILKDISTVRYEPQRLEEWGRVAMQVVGG
ncbi:MAG: hypothetical protein K8T26_17465 [Lentisphaerae bacterium]|nr:hypothetical protein [Lentisphaerota bacterium]